MRMKLYLMVAVVIVVACGTALAQDSVPKLELFGGYSYMRTSGSSNINGWNAQAAYNVNRWIGIAGDFAGHYQTSADADPRLGTSARPYASVLSFLFGPQFSERAGRAKGFGHFLLGMAKVGSGFQSGNKGVVANTSVFSFVAGGGFDVTVNEMFSVRAISLDYQFINLPDVPIQPAGKISTGHNDIRLSIGLIFKIK